MTIQENVARPVPGQAEIALKLGAFLQEGQPNSSRWMVSFCDLRLKL